MTNFLFLSLCLIPQPIHSNKDYSTYAYIKHFMILVALLKNLTIEEMATSWSPLSSIISVSKPLSLHFLSVLCFSRITHTFFHFLRHNIFFFFALNSGPSTGLSPSVKLLKGSSSKYRKLPERRSVSKNSYMLL